MKKAKCTECGLVCGSKAGLAAHMAHKHKGHHEPVAEERPTGVPVNYCVGCGLNIEAIRQRLR